MQAIVCGTDVVYPLREVMEPCLVPIAFKLCAEFTCTTICSS